MCLGGGGGYTPPPMKQAPAPQPGPASPNDMVNNQQIENANDRSDMEGNRNAMDPKKNTGFMNDGTGKLKSELKVQKSTTGINL